MLTFKTKNMKKNLLKAFCGSFASVLLFSSSFAQTGAAPAAVAISKIDWTRSASEPARLEKPATSVTPKTLRSFHLTFKDITPTWYTLGKEYVAKFSMNGRPGHALFAKNGFMFYSVCTGSEKDLPADVRRIVKSSYVDFAITSITEAHSGALTGWIINLQDDKSLVIVKVVDREMEELAHYQKSGTAK